MVFAKLPLGTWALILLTLTDSRSDEIQKWIALVIRKSKMVGTSGNFVLARLSRHLPWLEPISFGKMSLSNVCFVT